MRPSRNAPCPCGSGRKYKRCCGSSLATTENPPDVVVPRRSPTCAFSCATDCAALCCGGATLATIDEIRKLYEIFPITIGFRKYRPASPRHLDLLQTIGIQGGEHFVIGDFIAGNRFASRCACLREDSRCDLHAKGLKPLQCIIVPFCAVYPEDMQDVVFHEQRQSAFALCKGYVTDTDDDDVVWAGGKFTDEVIRSAFLSFQRGLRRQRPLMERILVELRRGGAMADFIRGEGLLEAIPTPNLLFEILEAAGFDDRERQDFVMAQIRLCDLALSTQDSRNPTLRDYRFMLGGI